MKAVLIRIVLLAGLLGWGAAASLAAQVKVYDPSTGKWKEAPQAVEAMGDNAAIIWLFKPDSGADSKAIAAVELKGRMEFMSSGIVSGEQSLVDLRFFDPPDFNPETPGKWQKIAKAELIQGRVVLTLDDGRVFTMYGMSGFSAVIEPGRVIPEPPKPAAN